MNHRRKNTSHWNSVSTGKSDCTHRHLHLELILVELEEDVGECTLQEGSGPQNQYQLEVPWEGALQWGCRCTLSHTQQSRHDPPVSWINYTSHCSVSADSLHFLYIIPSFCLSHVKTLAQTHLSMCMEEYLRVGKMWGMYGTVLWQGH